MCVRLSFFMMRIENNKTIITISKNVNANNFYSFMVDTYFNFENG